ncbi:hypothetical protein CsatB_028742 [Cannabis sativa]
MNEISLMNGDTDGKIRIESVPELEYLYYGGHMELSISIDMSNSLSGKVVICERGYNNGYDGSWFTGSHLARKVEEGMSFSIAQLEASQNFY